MTVSQLQSSQPDIPVTQCAAGQPCEPLTATQVAALDKNQQVFVCGDASGVCVGDGCNVGAGNTGGSPPTNSFNPVDQHDQGNPDRGNMSTSTTNAAPS